jgi:putative two-component system response regulator
MLQDLRDATILVVDDEHQNIGLLELVLRQAGYTKVVSTTDSRKALPLFVEASPDLVLLDMNMPHLSGFQVLAQLRAELDRDAYLPVLVLSGDVSAETRQKALADGAMDFLNKPFDSTEVLLRIRNLLHSRFLHVKLQSQNRELEAKVRRRTRALEEAAVEILERLARAAEYRDDATGQHTERVGRLSGKLAAALGLDDSQVDLIRRAAPLHDVGKIGIPDQILLKPGKLTDEEFEVIKGHTTIGARILSGSHFPLLQLAEEIALTHHERWDGKGYSPGLAGEDIPISARILAVADTYDAMTHDRPYRSALPAEAAREEIAREGGRQFDPKVVDAFMSLPTACLH